MGYLDRSLNEIIEKLTEEAKQSLRKTLETKLEEEFKKMSPQIISACLEKISFATNLILQENSSIPMFRVQIDFKKERN